MNPSSKPITAGERFRIGASLIPPFAILWLASRKGWVGVPPKACLIAMPLAVLLGMALPGVFAPWHRGFSRVQSRIGRSFLAGILYVVFFLAVTPLALILKLSGKRFIDSSPTGSSWIPAKPPGSLRDQF